LTTLIIQGLDDQRGQTRLTPPGRPGRPVIRLALTLHPLVIIIHDFAEAVGPEGFLPGHLNASADRQRFEPALTFRPTPACASATAS
jgi:hypothetical protein